MDQTDKVKAPEFLSGGGEMGNRIRNFDWSNTSLGDPEQWEQSLKTCVRIMLSSSQPIWIGWGPELIKLYNDPYIDIVRGKHPGALGQPAAIVWKDIWKDIEPLLHKAMYNDEGTYVESQLLIMERSGYLEETYYTFSYTPVLGANGKPAGMICYNTADTERIINERALKTLQQLDVLAHKKDEQEIYNQAAIALQTNNRDFPFALIYQIESGDKASLIASAGIDKHHPEIPGTIDLTNDTGNFKDLIAVFNGNKIVEEENDGSWKNLPHGAWDVMPRNFVHVPVKAANKKFPLAILTLALNPYRKFDDGYRNFVQLIADQVSLGINNAIAYQEERNRAEALAELDKSKTIFFSNVSHEFRTPLTLMLGTIEEALHDGQTRPENRERMNVAHRNAMRLLKLVNTLLDFSRIESGRQKANYTLTDLAAFTENLSGNFRAAMERAGLEFNVKTAPLEGSVYIDRQMWEKIVFNLLSNAFKYTISGKITVKVFSENNSVVLSVEDTGAGIPEKELPRMFERFHRVENVVGRSYEGTGIGLSLTRELVQLHGGSITVKSIEGEGSTFTVTLPFGKDHLPAEQTSDSIKSFEEVIVDAYIEEAQSLLETSQPHAASSPSIANQDHQPATVLVVDDNADMRRHIQSILQKHFRVVTATNGMDALHQLRMFHPSLVLSDIMMPILDGIQLLREIKSNAQTAHLPVILLTARAGEESKVEGFETGADDYLVKPFSANELLARIRGQVALSEKRQEVEKRLKEFLLQAPAAIAVMEGADFTFTLANSRYEKMFGRKKEELLGHSFTEVFGELKDQEIFQLLSAVYKSGEPYTANEFAISFKENSETITRHFDFALHPIKKDDGTVTDIMFHAVETTQQVSAKRKTEENQKELQELLKQAPVAITLYEGENLVARVANARSLQMMGKKEEEVLNQPMESFFADLPERRQIYREVFETGIPYSGKEIAISFSRNGANYKGYYDLNYVPWYGTDGRIRGVISVGTEVTDRVLARLKIELSEKKYADLIHGLPVAVYTCDADGRLALFNDAAIKLLGEIQPTGQKDWSGYFKIYRSDGTPFSAEESPLQIHTDAGTRGPVDIIIERPDGVRRHVIFHPQIIYDHEKKVTGTVNTLIDITDQVEARKKIENVSAELELKVAERTMQLKTSLDILHHAEETAAMGNWQWNLASNQITWSDNLYKMLDYDRNDVAPSFENLAAIVHPADRLRVTLRYRRAMETKSLEEDVFRIITRQRKLKYIRVTGSKLLLGEEEYIIGTSQDVTESEKAAETIREKNAALENSRSFLQQLIDSSVEFISVLDRDLRYLTVNRKFEERIGLSRSELQGKLFVKVTPEAAGTIQHESILNALSGKTIYLDKRPSVERPEMFVDTYFIPLTIQGEVEGIIIMARDVTEIVKSEYILEQKNEELERSNKELESFNYIASHDLQEPLRKIQTFIWLLEKNRDDEKSWKKYSAKISTAASRMKNLIQSVLDYSRSSQSAGAFVETDLNEVLENVKTDYELLIAEKEVLIYSDPLPVVMAVPLQMQQLFANLLSNSLKFTERPPVITITATVTPGDQVPGARKLNALQKFAVIRFTDNGIGFDPKYNELVFKLFQRLHNKTEYSGTGVGLSIVSKIVALHNGFIKAESESGNGTTFIIWLPLSQQV